MLHKRCAAADAISPFLSSLDIDANHKCVICTACVKVLTIGGDPAADVWESGEVEALSFRISKLDPPEIPAASTVSNVGGERDVAGDASNWDEVRIRGDPAKKLKLDFSPLFHYLQVATWLITREKRHLPTPSPTSESYPTTTGYPVGLNWIN